MGRERSRPDFFAGVVTWSGGTLQLNQHAKLLQFALDVGQRELQCGAAVRAGCALRKHVLSLHLQCLYSSLAFGRDSGCIAIDLGCGRFGRRCLCLLFFDALRFPAFGHTNILAILSAGEQRNRDGGRLL